MGEFRRGGLWTFASLDVGEFRRGIEFFSACFHSCLSCLLFIVHHQNRPK